MNKLGALLLAVSLLVVGLVGYKLEHPQHASALVQSSFHYTDRQTIGTSETLIFAAAEGHSLNLQVFEFALDTTGTVRFRKGVSGGDTLVWETVPTANTMRELSTIFGSTCDVSGGLTATLVTGSATLTWNARGTDTH